MLATLKLLDRTPGWAMGLGQKPAIKLLASILIDVVGSFPERSLAPSCLVTVGAAHSRLPQQSRAAGRHRDVPRTSGRGRSRHWLGPGELYPHPGALRQQRCAALPRVDFALPARPAARLTGVRRGRGQFWLGWG